MDFVNLIIGSLLLIMGIAIIFVGNYFSKKIGIIHVLIYFMGSLVIFGGVVFGLGKRIVRLIRQIHVIYHLIEHVSTRDEKSLRRKSVQYL